MTNERSIEGILRAGGLAVIEADDDDGSAVLTVFETTEEMAEFLRLLEAHKVANPDGGRK